MKPGVMRTSRISSARRPSVRVYDPLAGVKLIVPPDFNGFESARRAAQEALGDVRERLRRVRHVEVIQIIAQKALARTRLAQVAKLLRRRAPKALSLYQILNGLRRRLARINQTHARAHRFLNHAAQDGVMRAAQYERTHFALAQLAKIFFGDRARHVRLRPALLRKRDEERARPLRNFDARREPSDRLPVSAALDGRLRRDDADAARLGRDADGCPRARLDHANDGHRDAAPYRRQRQRRRRVAGDDEQLDAARLEEPRVLN